MICAPLSWNLIASGTASTNAAAYERGHGQAKLVTTDFADVAIWRGLFVVSAGVNDAIDYGAGSSATVTAATYYSASEYIAACAAALNTASASTDWSARWRVDSLARNLFVLLHASGDTLENGTGANAATNSLVKLAGFRSQDRTSGVNHQGDYPTIHQYAPADWDLGSAITTTAECAFLVNPDLGPTGNASMLMGTTTAVSDQTVTFGGMAHHPVWFVRYASPYTYRYISLRLEAPRRNDASHAACGYAYHGPLFDTDETYAHERIDFDVTSLGMGWSPKHGAKDTITGEAITSEVQPAERLRINIGKAGMHEDTKAALFDFAQALGRGSMMALALDDTEEPTANTRIVRIVDQSSFRNLPMQSVAGRWALTLEVETVTW